MMKIYGISSCGTVKKAKAWLQAHGQNFEAIDLRQTPPSAELVANWVATFGSKAMRNTSGGAYRALGADKTQWSEERWAAEFTAEPMLIKRPIIERQGRPLKVGFRGTEAELEAELL
jgi:arsenate reductase